MPINDFMSNIFASLRGGMTDSEFYIRNAWVDQLEQTDAEQREYAQKLVNWYNRDTAAIREHIKTASSPLFKKSKERWLIPVLNTVPRIVKRLSLAYVQAPTRHLKRGTNTVDVGTPLWDSIYGPEGIFHLIDIDKKYKEMDRWSKLLNTMHVEVVPRRGALDWDMHLRPGTTVIPDPSDYLELVKLAYRYCPMDPETLRLQMGWVYWSKDVHAYRLDNGEWHGVSITDGDTEGDNPYGGEVPIVTVRQVEQDDYWGAYGADLVEAVEHTHVQICNMWFNAFMQSHGQPVGINLKLPPGQQLAIGPDNPILVDDVQKDDVQPSLTFAKSDSETTTVREMIDWFIKSVGQAYGLPPGSWALDTVPESGFAKFMSNIELLEDRDDSRPMWCKVEQDIFDKSIMVWNRWAKEMRGKALPEDLSLEVEFPPVKFPESPTEKMTRYTIAIGAGLSSPIRYFMEEEGLEEDEARKKAIQVQQEIEEVKAAVVDQQVARMKKLNFGQEPPQPGGKEPGLKEPPSKEGEK